MTDDKITKDLTPAQEPPEDTAEETKPAKPVKVVWKAVQPRHYARAMEMRKPERVTYVLRLVETVDGNLVAPADATLGEVPPGAVVLTKAQARQILSDFEAAFAPKEDSK